METKLKSLGWTRAQLSPNKVTPFTAWCVFGCPDSTDIDVAYFLLARIKSDDLKLDMEGLALEMASVGYHVKTKELDVTPIYMENGMVCVTGVAAEPKGAIEAEVKAEAKTEAKTELQPNLYTKVGLVRTWEKAHPGHGQYVGWCLTRGERGVVPPWKSFFKQFQEFALQLVGEEMKELDLSWTRNSTPPTWLKRGAQGLLFVKAATNPSHLILRRFQRLFHVAFV